jgi:hypothetical protein
MMQTLRLPLHLYGTQNAENAQLKDRRVGSACGGKHSILALSWQLDGNRRPFAHPSTQLVIETLRCAAPGHIMLKIASVMVAPLSSTSSRQLSRE